jgi:hypothetical protein
MLLNFHACSSLRNGGELSSAVCMPSFTIDPGFLCVHRFLYGDYKVVDCPT